MTELLGLPLTPDYLICDSREHLLVHRPSPVRLASSARHFVAVSVREHRTGHFCLCRAQDAPVISARAPSASLTAGP